MHYDADFARDTIANGIMQMEAFDTSVLYHRGNAEKLGRESINRARIKT